MCDFTYTLIESLVSHIAAFRKLAVQRHTHYRSVYVVYCLKSNMEPNRVQKARARTAIDVCWKELKPIATLVTSAMSPRSLPTLFPRVPSSACLRFVLQLCARVVLMTHIVVVDKAPRIFDVSLFPGQYSCKPIHTAVGAVGANHRECSASPHLQCCTCRTKTTSTHIEDAPLH